MLDAGQDSADRAGGIVDSLIQASSRAAMLHRLRSSPARRPSRAVARPAAALRRARARATPPTRRPTASSRPSRADDYAQALAQRGGGRRALARAAVAVRAHPVLRVALLLLRLQQDRHPAQEQAAPSTCDYLAREVDLQIAQLGRGAAGHAAAPGRRHADLPVGRRELRELMAMLRAHFALAPGGEYSIEIDPRTVDAERLATLAELGFNRLSFGVQDFDPEVQKAVHRIQPAEQVFDLMADARGARLRLDQRRPDLRPAAADAANPSPARWRRCASCGPDRIALYAYAHLPERFKPQRRIVDRDLPDAAAKVADAVALDRRAHRGRLRLHRHGPFRAAATTRWRWPSGRAGCIATSRATARSRTAT